MKTTPEDQQTPTLLSLPQEIQDIIFNLAYQRRPEIGFINRTDWRRVRQRNDSAFRHKVNDLLVSKSYFVAASRAWIGEHAFQARDLVVARSMRIEYRGMSRYQGIIPAFVREVTIAVRDVELVRVLPSLKVLRITIHASWFWILGIEGIATAQELTPKHFHYPFKEKSMLRDLRGLKELHLVPEPLTGSFWDSQTERGALRGRLMLTLNITCFQDFLQPLVTRPKVETHTGAELVHLPFQELYPRSAVNFGAHQLSFIRLNVPKPRKNRIESPATSTTTTNILTLRRDQKMEAFRTIRE